MTIDYEHYVKVKVASPISDHHIPISGNTEDDRTHAKRHLSVGVVLGILTVLSISLLFYIIKTKLIPALKRRSQIVHAIKNMKDEKIMLRRFKLEEILKATNNFSEESLLGCGAFGNVYKAAFDIEGTLAIKRPHAESYQSIEEFRNEVRLLSKVKHSNLVGLVGFCEGRGSRMLVYEYVPNGSLLEYFTGKREKILNWRQRVNIAIGAAKGIAYLHEEMRPSIIHRDIKPSNIMVGDGFEAKVSDFGLVKSGPTGDQSHVSSQVKGTPGYLDPAYCSTFHLTPYSDVFSFGVILLQLVTARPAFETNTFHSNYHIIDWARASLERGEVEEIIDVNLLSDQCNMKMMLKMGQLGLRCVVKTPKERPTMTQVCQELQEEFYLAQNHINKHPSWGSRRSMDFDHSQLHFVCIDGVEFQRFHVEMEILSLTNIQRTVLRCSDSKDNSINMDNNEAVTSEDQRKEDGH